MFDEPAFSAPTKYTDRDVRENPELVRRAIQFLENYTGDFEYLLDIRRGIDAGNPLTVGMTRGILNCMRNDVRISGSLPEPMFPAPVQQPRSSRKRVTIDLPEEKIVRSCGKLASHDKHYWYKNKDDYDGIECPGVPWEITRVRRKVIECTIHALWAKARTGRLVHLVQNKSGTITWSNSVHEYGYGTPELAVLVVCPISILRKPILYKEKPEELLLKQLDVGFCHRCICAETDSTN